MKIILHLISGEIHTYSNEEISYAYKTLNGKIVLENHAFYQLENVNNEINKFVTEHPEGEFVIKKTKNSLEYISFADVEQIEIILS